MEFAMTKQKVLWVLFVFACGTAQASDVLNIRTDPLMVFGGTYINLELDFRLTDHWSVGPIAQANTFEPLYRAGVRASYYEAGTFKQGWMTGIEAGLRQFVDDNRSYNNDKGSFCEWVVDQEVCGLKAERALSIALDHGYLLRWGTFNVGLGLGAELTSKVDNLSDISLLPKVQLAIGWIR